jgi:hypothetical protein
MRETSRAFTMAAALVALVACGSDNNNNNGTGGGALTARTLQGEITALDNSSVTVNGIKTDDSTTTGKIFIDDNPSTHDLLKLGQVVTVRIDDNGKTTEIRSRPEVRGTLDDSSKTASSFTVGGQVVRVDDSTHFEDNTTRLGGVGATDRVRVSGYPDDKGGLRATRVDRDTSGSTDFELHGVVSNLLGNTFTLKTSSSSAATAYTVTATTLPAGLANGSFVEVKSASKPTATGTAITATSVKVDDDSSLGSSNSEAEVEGIVVSGTSASFVIRTRTVTTSATTKWIGGAPADLILGVKVEAEGKLDATGNIAASKVVFHDSLRFQSAVSGVVPASLTDLKNGTFQMLGGTLTVHVSDVTEFDSSGVADLSALTTQNVEVRGYPTVAGGNDIVATRIKLGTGGGSGGGGGGGGGVSTRIVIQGPITALNAKTFKILGYTIDGSAASSLSRDDNPLSDPSAVFTGLANGMVVKARADAPTALTGTTLVAKELELEDDK